jgi:hypothetical protein
MPDPATNSVYVEIMKALGPAVVAAWAGYIIKGRETRKQAERGREAKEQERRAAQMQTHWSPLLEATRELRSRLEELTAVYQREEGVHFDPDSLSADFRELYMLKRDPIPDRESVDPNWPRRDEQLKQYIRTRMSHQLTFAVSSLYRMAKYLGCAERVWRDLKDYRLALPASSREEMMRLIAHVKDSLQGPGGAGIFGEQQESIAEVMWDPAGQVITNFEFRKRLLELPGWEQFTGIFRFFYSRGSENQGKEWCEFKSKLDYEVKSTIQALRQLEENVDRLLSVFNPVRT